MARRRLFNEGNESFKKERRKERTFVYRRGSILARRGSALFRGIKLVRRSGTSRDLSWMECVDGLRGWRSGFASFWLDVRGFASFTG